MVLKVVPFELLYNFFYDFIVKNKIMYIVMLRFSSYILYIYIKYTNLHKEEGVK